MKFHNWWNAPADLGQGAGDRPGRLARLVDGEFSLDAAAGVEQPTQQQADDRPGAHAADDPEAVRDYLGDGNFGGYYERPDEEMLAIWEVAVEETRALLEGPWA